MEIPGYAGSILYADLASGHTRKEPLDPNLARTLIGGHGMNWKLAYDLVPPDADPLSPENAIIIGVGPFSGTLVPGTPELVITSKLPLSGGFGTNAGGGHFPLMLKSSGYDHVVITGRAEKPVYLKVFDDEVEICDASHLWGRDIFETVDELRSLYEPCSVIPIGPSGENLVRVSMTSIDKLGTVGFGGLPAVMGSKNLKAVVAVQGTREIRVAHRLRLLKAVDQMLERVMGYRLRPTLLEGGTFAMSAGWLGIGGQGWDDIRRESRQTLACPSCPMGDKERHRLAKGDCSPMVSYSTDFMGEFESSGKTPLDNHNRAVKRLDTFNKQGICRFHFRDALRLMTSLYQQGIITTEDTGGVELNGDYDTTLKLIGMTARREGCGDLLADGALRAARRIGRGAEEQVIHIKGCSQFIDPRIDSFNTMSFAQLVHPGRPHYACGGIGVYMPGRPLDLFIKHAERIGVPDEAKRRIFGPASFDVGRLTKHAEDWFSLFNCLGLCHRVYISRFHSIEGVVEFYSAITGIETTAAEMLKAAERAWNISRLLNVRAGFGRNDDTPPRGWFTPPSARNREFPLRDYFGAASFASEDVEGVLDDYYDERGWDKESGIPTPDKLKELGLESHQP
jgi:aldehyde:ferredoxin oxidoreductase